MIVKIQLPIASSESEPLALIYDEKRTFAIQSALSSPLRAIMKGRAKAFFKATFDRRSGALEILEEVPALPW